LYAETRSWFSTDGIEEKVVAELDNVAQNIQVMFQNNQRDTFVDFEILQRLNKVFRIIIQECHISELMLKIDKPKGNMLDAD
jgi:hypothetical protein